MNKQISKQEKAAENLHKIALDMNREDYRIVMYHSKDKFTMEQLSILSQVCDRLLKEDIQNMMKMTVIMPYGLNDLDPMAEGRICDGETRTHVKC